MPAIGLENIHQINEIESLVVVSFQVDQHLLHIFVGGLEEQQVVACCISVEQVPEEPFSEVKLVSVEV